MSQSPAPATRQRGMEFIRLGDQLIIPRHDFAHARKVATEGETIVEVAVRSRSDQRPFQIKGEAAIDAWKELNHQFGYG